MKEGKSEVELDSIEEISTISEKRSTTFEHDPNESYDRNASILPERNLLRAVLDRAFQDLLSGDPNLKQEAKLRYDIDNKIY